MRLLVLQHVPHERLGTLERALKEAGASLRSLHTAHTPGPWPSPRDFDGLIVMGGPQSVYQQAAHPYLARELALLEEALKAQQPVLGVCLGAQLLAAALGAKVARSPQQEIGWYPVMREPGADGDPLCEPFGQTETVFQWHGDTFALPKGAVRLFSSPLCAQQGFRYGRRAYGVQFHVEVTAAMIRLWLSHPSNRKALAALRGAIDPESIRRQTPTHIHRLEELSRHVAAAFCRLAQPSSTASIGRPAHARR